MDSYLERLQRAVAAAKQGICDEDRKPRSDGKWSAAEVLEHLYLTYTGTSKAFDRCLQAGKPLASASTLKHRLAAFLVTECGYFPEGRKSPERACPKGISAEKVVADICPQIAAMDKIIAQCEERFGSRKTVLDHPVLGPLTAKQWRKFHWVHGRHHIKQILERRKSTPV